MGLLPPTQSWVLRCWPVRQEGGIRWRFRVEMFDTGQVLCFDGLEELVIFLRERFTPTEAPLED